VLQDVFVIKDKNNEKTGKAILKIPESNIKEFLQEYNNTTIKGAYIYMQK